MRTQTGGGTRCALVEMEKGLFFPNGHSTKGRVEDYILSAILNKTRFLQMTLLPDSMNKPNSNCLDFTVAQKKGADQRIRSVVI